MGVWNDAAGLKLIYKKLENMPPAKLDAVVRQAKREIKGRLAGRYDTSTWDAATPPDLISIHEQLSYGLANRATHEGDRATPSDQTGTEARKEARDLLMAYATGTLVLTDDAGVEIPQRSSDGSAFARVTEPVFGMRDPIQWRISDAAAPTRSGGVDGFGVF
jgi:hypothetical protein